MNSFIEMPRAVRIGAAVTSIIGTLGIGAASFVLSFQSLTELKNQHSSFSDHSWMWAVALDGLIVVASIALVAMVSAQPKQRAWALTLLLTGVLLSTAGNVTHSVLNAHGLIGALIAAIPPLMLAAVTHLTVQLLRYALVIKTLKSTDEHVSVEEAELSAVTVSAANAEVERAQEPTVSALSGATTPDVCAENERTPMSASVPVERQDERVSVVLSEREKVQPEPITSVSAPSPLTTVSNNFKKTSDKSERASGTKAVEVRAENNRTPVAASAAPKTSDNGEFLVWFKAQENPEQVTGTDIAAEFGCAPATGRRWKAKALESLTLQAA